MELQRRCRVWGAAVTGRERAAPGAVGMGTGALAAALTADRTVGIKLMKWN